MLTTSSYLIQQLVSVRNTFFILNLSIDQFTILTLATTIWPIDRGSKISMIAAAQETYLIKQQGNEPLVGYKKRVTNALKGIKALSV
jgi:hypothetical protein